MIRRWKVVKRTNRGSYLTSYFLLHGKAEADAREFMEKGLGQASVTRA